MESGGAERVVSVLLNSLVKQYQCYLILLHQNIFYKLDDRIKIIYLNEDDKINGIEKVLRLPFVARKLSQIVIENQLETVVSFLSRSNYVNILSSHLSKHKAVISERALPSLQYKNGISGSINRFLIKFLYPKSNLCIANSIGNANDLKNNFNIKNLITIYNPFHLSMIQELSYNKIEVQKKRFTFITVGRLDSGKNHKLIISAMKNLNADLWIIGDGELKNKLKEYILIENLSDKVFLLGRKENPFSYMSKADTFVFASNHEGFPNVLVESLVCRLPIISTDCKSGPREILSPNSNINMQIRDKVEISEYGVLTPIENIQYLEEAMKMMISDISLRENYRDKALKRAYAFHVDKIVKKYEEVICAE